jgi:hypothetical protein
MAPLCLNKADSPGERLSLICSILSKRQTAVLRRSRRSWGRGPAPARADGPQGRVRTPVDHVCAGGGARPGGRDLQYRRPQRMRQHPGGVTTTSLLLDEIEALGDGPARAAYPVGRRPARPRSKIRDLYLEGGAGRTSAASGSCSARVTLGSNSQGSSEWVDDHDAFDLATVDHVLGIDVENAQDG